MTLDEIRAAQHMERKYQSDAQLDWFLDDTPPSAPILDLLPLSEGERLHLARARAVA